MYVALIDKNNVMSMFTDIEIVDNSTKVDIRNTGGNDYIGESNMSVDPNVNNAAECMWQL